MAPDSSEPGRLSDPAVETWEALLRTHAALTPLLAGLIEEETGLPLAWYDVLLELSRTPNRQLRMHELSERVVLSRSRVSRVVDEMVAADLVLKVPDPEDGRATLARMTPAGVTALRRAAPVYLRGIGEHFAKHLSATQVSSMKDALGNVLAALGGR